MASALVCYNPIAGRGRGAAVAGALRGLLPGAEFSDAHPAGADAEVYRGRDVILCVGGDGTLRANVSAVLAANADDADLPAVGVVPLGTANLMAQHLGVQPPGLLRPKWLDAAPVLEAAGPWLGAAGPLGALAGAVADWPARQLAASAARSVRAGKTRQVDLATAGDEMMLLMAGVGLDAEVIHALQGGRAGPIRRLDYLPAAAAAAWNYAFPRLTVRVDGAPIGPPARGVAFCANVPEYGLGVPMLPGARGDDGLLDACLLPAADKLALLDLTLAAVGGAHHAVPGARRARGRVVEIEADSPAAVQVDGEPAGRTPLTCRVTPRRLRFLLPA